MNAKLHNYSCDTKDRQLIHIWIACISIFLSYMVNLFIEFVSIKIPWWIDSPSIFGFYGALYYIFKEYLWKDNTIRKIFSIKTPNWNGLHECILNTSYDNFQSKTDVTVKIIQNWDKILIQLSTNHSNSISLSGSFAVNDSVTPQFTYMYRNEPNNSSALTMNIHYGMANIEFDSDKLKIEYFNGRGRNTYGKMVEKRKNM